MPTDMSEWSDLFASGFQSSDDIGAQLLQLVVIIAIIWILRWLLLRSILKRTQDASTIYWITKISSYVASALSLIAIGRTLLGGFTSLLTLIGLIAAGLAIALRDPLTNLFAWLFIVWRRPFELGHRIQIGDAIGDVVDVRIFQTSLLELGQWVGSDQPTGRIIHVPNSYVFSEMQFNYSVGIPFIWDEIPVLITFESDWRKAKRLLVEIVERGVPAHARVSQEDLRRMSRAFRLSGLETEPVVYTSVDDSGVRLTLRYTVRPSERRKLQESMWEAILTEFGKHPDIEFAYPTTRFYDDIRERERASLDARNTEG